LDRGRHLGAGGDARVPRAQGADPARHAAARASAIFARARRPLHPERPADRGRSSPHDENRRTLMAGITPIVMPKWGLAMKEGTIVAWLVEDGAQITVGAPILDVETDKIANAVEAADPGLLRRRVAQEGATLPVKALLGVM